ncbi:ATP-dependent helicase [Fluoribacter gormanii]|uniref:ATP-dependent helicase n=1 Tax=Fluoribacter gormanii TaxID=464 RepID=UPI0022431D3C|nr:ATP-dependent helicase [Fluoribacter gormanii]MCW8469371.1 ATP-dependent helicase [Fluoribacter gormanii]
MKLSTEQLKIVDASLTPISVIACAGSGKTITAIHRLKKIRLNIKDSRSWVALLSFSNVAVDTFKNNYYDLMAYDFPSLYDHRVLIETFDGFITKNILNPHGSLVMDCDKIPFLLSGSESFLKNNNYKFWYSVKGRDYPIEPKNLDDISIRIQNNEIILYYRLKSGDSVRINNGLQIVSRLGKLGAYTHEFGRYWALMALKKYPSLLRVLSNRFSHIIIDEAQDVGILHQFLLELLIKQGSVISLIGDPFQAIYEFSGADGKFLHEYKNLDKVSNYVLTTNYRSIPSIVSVANHITASSNIGNGQNLNADFGAYFITYDPQNPKILIDFFIGKINELNIAIQKSAILCRSNALVNDLKGQNPNLGQGKTRLLIKATLLRDIDNNFNSAFNLVSQCIVGLLVNPPENLYSEILQANKSSEFYELKKDIWFFVRDHANGLPSSELRAITMWLPQVRKALKNILEKFHCRFGIGYISSINSHLSRKELTDEPLNNSSKREQNIRIDTVHKAKGESIDAVLYFAQKEHISKMLDGVNTELGRIGYVALTRARQLFILGVPSNKIGSFRSKLTNLGMKELK